MKKRHARQARFYRDKSSSLDAEIKRLERDIARRERAQQDALKIREILGLDEPKT